MKLSILQYLWEHMSADEKDETSKSIWKVSTMVTFDEAGEAHLRDANTGAYLGAQG